MVAARVLPSVLFLLWLLPLQVELRRLRLLPLRLIPLQVGAHRLWLLWLLGVRMARRWWRIGSRGGKRRPTWPRWLSRTRRTSK